MASFFLLFSVVGILIITCLSLACFAMGLLSLCEVVEQKPNFLKKLFKKFVYALAIVHVGFILFDCLSLWRFLLSLLVLALHFRFHLELPKVTLVPSLVNLAAVFFNHFMWLSYFYRNNRHPIWEVASFYFFIVWSAPLFIVINYSTSEVLPGFYEDSYKSQKRKY